MFASRGWMRFALLCNLLGTVLLFLSFQATSSNLVLKRAPDGSTAVCIGRLGLFVVRPGETGMGIAGACPAWPNARPTAVVNIEKPYMVTLGFILTSLGFLLQVLAIPSPKTIAQMRADLKAAKMQQRLKEEQIKLTRLSS